MFWGLTILVLSFVVNEAYGDYMCACVHGAEKSVYSTNSTGDVLLGMMLEFDCKPLAYIDYGEEWITIQYQHKVGFLEADGKNIQINNCSGALPVADKVPVPTPIVITIATQAPTYHIVPQTVPTDTSPTATSASNSFVQGHVSLCPPRIQQLAKRPGTTLGQFGHSCYEVVQGSIAWKHAETVCIQNGGHLAHIETQPEQDFIHNFLIKEHSHVVWIGLHDLNSEEHFTWSTGGAVNYTNWAPNRYTSQHDVEDCVYMAPDTGLWNDAECGVNLPLLEILGSTHGYICEFDTLDKSPDGDVSLCTDTARLHVVSTGGSLGQYKDSCYEINPHQFSWSTAEGYCQSNGGHLAHINNADEQAYIQSFMMRHSPQNAAWIGLTDTATEGTFQWTDGQQPTQYTNWAIGQGGNHNEKDCVIFSPIHNGQWTDETCDHTTGGFLLGIFGGSTSRYQSLCQYNTNLAASVIG